MFTAGRSEGWLWQVSVNHPVYLTIPKAFRTGLLIGLMPRTGN